MDHESRWGNAVLEVLGEWGRGMHPRELAIKLDLEPEDYDALLDDLEDLMEAGLVKELPGGRVRARGRKLTRPKPTARGLAEIVEKKGRTSAARTQSKKERPPKANKEKTAEQSDKSLRQKKEKPSKKRSDSTKKSSPKKKFKTTSSQWEGRITVHARGFAFVTRQGQDDVFIPADAVYEALHGDQVLVRVTGRSRKGLEGVVEQVTQRRDPRFTGTLRCKTKSQWIEPDDSRLRSPILIKENKVDARDGDAVVAAINRFPAFSDELAEAELVEVLGPAGDLKTEERKILIGNAVRQEHPPEVLLNAEEMAERLKKAKLGKRRDLRQIPLPTIDPEDARDHDDAIWVEKYRSGYRAYIAIADVSEYVREGSALDEEARARGCTIYLPDRAIPMLPRVLAADLCSLLPEQDRFCMCVIADLNKKGEVKTYEVVEGLMRSHARLTYDGVARTLGFDEESPQSAAAEAMKPNLELLYELSQKLRQTRSKKGALNLDLPEPRVVVDEETGAPLEIKKRATRPGLKLAYSMVEEMMLLANELVALWLDEEKLPGIYRVHAEPDPEKLEKLAMIADEMEVAIDIESLQDPIGVAKFLNSLEGHPKKSILEKLLLRSLKQAQYDTENIGHFGLAKEYYVHFTSPIRRYPDLRVHRQIKSVLRGEKSKQKPKKIIEDLTEAAHESSKRERDAIGVEREILDLYRASYMKQHIGDVFVGRITGFSGMGVYVSLDEPFVDVMIPYEC
ncbi:MAG: VacB/RNase II family 3'-5' exoribonuclease [Polyangiaceae bacterium]|nr:VacB/RNase II family 3'-5' exoribonuclease [Polyangiaceae bacterium]